eukprot:TRINITY_DN1088_c0_g1_i2.p1 TRINITY_DN1088_c0_g1~~TRINITY_DN1088_c0_g1_i2.p1  ORF type:complete len:1396 (+),score=270.62 TRINITY_DN1088_c0_g1_i2:1430-5617(+)
MLGHGLYFSAQPEDSLCYCTPSLEDQTCFMFACRVALGKTLDVTQIRSDLVQPPDPTCQSVHAVKTSPLRTTDFAHDEFVVYSATQQHLQYLITFRRKNCNSKKAPPADPLVLPVFFVDESASLRGREPAAAAAVPGPTQAPPPPPRAGLMSTSGALVRLLEVNVQAKIVDVVAEVTLYQHYKNDSVITVEAKYVFPLDKRAAVCQFEAYINDRRIVGVVKEKTCAHEEYREAVSQGKGAYLLDEEKDDLFCVSIGNLPPLADIILKLTYVGELGYKGKAVQFIVPSSSHFPRAQAEAAYSSVSQGTTGTAEAQNNGAFTCQVAVETAFNIVCVASPSHAIQSKRSDNRATVKTLPTGPLLTDFVLEIVAENESVPRIWLEQDESGHTATMVSYFPTVDQVATEPRQLSYVLALDLSNSLSGAAFFHLRMFAQILIQCLPIGSNVNVLTFGSTYEWLFVKPKEVTLELLNQTLLPFLEGKIAPSLGATELWAPLRSAFVLSGGVLQHPLNIFLITDGLFSSDFQHTLSAVEHVKNNSRLFVYGVGPSADRYSIAALARACGGDSELLSATASVAELWDAARRHVKQSQLSALSNFDLQWATTHPMLQAPASLPTIFQGDRLLVLAHGLCTHATLRWLVAGEEGSCVVSTSDLLSTRGRLIHTLSAKAMIRDWEKADFTGDRLQSEAKKNALRDNIVTLSCHYSVLCSLTSFVAIDEHSPVTLGKQTCPKMKEVCIVADNLPQQGWEEDQYQVEHVPKPTPAVPQQELEMPRIVERKSRLKITICRKAPPQRVTTPLHTTATRIAAKPIKREWKMGKEPAKNGEGTGKETVFDLTTFAKVEAEQQATATPAAALKKEASRSALPVKTEDRMQTGSKEHLGSSPPPVATAATCAAPDMKKEERKERTEEEFEEEFEDLGFDLFGGDDGFAAPPISVKKEKCKMEKRKEASDEDIDIVGSSLWSPSPTEALKPQATSRMERESNLCADLRRSRDEPCSPAAVAPAMVLRAAAYAVQMFTGWVAAPAAQAKPTRREPTSPPHVAAKATAPKLRPRSPPQPREDTSHPYTAMTGGKLHGHRKAALLVVTKKSNNSSQPEVVYSTGSGGAFCYKHARKCDSAGLPRTLLSPFGVTAFVSAVRQRSYNMSHVFRGPRCETFGKTCWVDSTVMFCLCIPSLRQKLVELCRSGRKTNPLLSILGRFFAFMTCEDHRIPEFHADLRTLYNPLKEWFSANGFPYGQPQSALPAALTLLCACERTLQQEGVTTGKLWAIVDATGVATSAEVRQLVNDAYRTSGCRFVVLVNGDFALQRDAPQLLVPGCTTLSLMTCTLSNSEKYGSHFRVWCPTPAPAEGVWVYDDMMSFGEGSFQAGFVPADAPSFALFRDSLCVHLPLVLVQLVD